uniref:Uncharacterized protein n=1 Tax=Wuchereria bancrofti TaxID=6293 RepID=A0A1I8F046_WUCBA
MKSSAQKKREYFLRHAEMSLSVPTRRKWYKKVPPMDFQKNTAEESCSDLRMSTTSNQLIGAVATWHSIHASLMKLGLSSDCVSSGKMMKASSKSFTSSSSRHSTDSFISYISDDCMLKHTHIKIGFRDPEETKNFNVYYISIIPSLMTSANNNQFINCIAALSGNQTSDGSLDDEKLFNCRSRLSVSNLELRSSQLKEMFPGLSEHWSFMFFSKKKKL